LIHDLKDTLLQKKRPNKYIRPFNLIINIDYINPASL